MKKTFVAVPVTESKGLSLKEIKERKILGARILMKLLNAKTSQITNAEIKVIADCLQDLEHLNELMNYMGEEAIKHQDELRLNRN